MHVLGINGINVLIDGQLEHERLSTMERLFLRQTRTYYSYLFSRLRFDCRNTQSVLKRAGITCPVITKDLAKVIVDFAISHNWGIENGLRYKKLKWFKNNWISSEREVIPPAFAGNPFSCFAVLQSNIAFDLRIQSMNYNNKCQTSDIKPRNIENRPEITNEITHVEYFEELIFARVNLCSLPRIESLNTVIRFDIEGDNTGSWSIVVERGLLKRVVRNYSDTSPLSDEAVLVPASTF